MTDHIHPSDELCSGCVDNGYLAGEEAVIEMVMAIKMPRRVRHIIKARFSEEFFPISYQGLMLLRRTNDEK